MQTKSIFIISLLAIVMLFSCKEEQVITNINPERKLIENTIEMYFEGWMTGDTTKIGKAMHATCQLKNVKDEEVIVFDRATYLGFFKPRPRRENSGGRIVDIDITGYIASAKCEIDTPKRLYTDYFNLMKLNDDWYIVDKIAMSVAKEEK